MNETSFRYVIPILVIVIAGLMRALRNRFYKPKYEDNVQKPGNLNRFIQNLFIFLTVMMFFFSALGLMMQDTEMTIVFAVVGLIFLVITLALRRAHMISYEENEEYFILKNKGKTYKVFYKDITDWQPAYNEIEILDETQLEEQYIRVNISIFKPEILLRKIADMAMEGKFNQESQFRQIETIDFLQHNNYGYLVEDYLEQK